MRALMGPDAAENAWIQDTRTHRSMEILENKW
jgi:hypothetical protein